MEFNHVMFERFLTFSELCNERPLLRGHYKVIVFGESCDFSVNVREGLSSSTVCCEPTNVSLT